MNSWPAFATAGTEEIDEEHQGSCRVRKEIDLAVRLNLKLAGQVKSVKTCQNH